jgi:hypothetical protein
MGATYAFVATLYGDEAADSTSHGSEYVRWTDADYDPLAMNTAAAAVRP